MLIVFFSCLHIALLRKNFERRRHRCPIQKQKKLLNFRIRGFGNKKKKKTYNNWQKYPQIEIEKRETIFESTYILNNNSKINKKKK